MTNHDMELKFDQIIQSISDLKVAQAVQGEKIDELTGSVKEHHQTHRAINIKAWCAIGAAALALFGDFLKTKLFG